MRPLPQCLICKLSDKTTQAQSSGDNYICDCPNCGKYKLTGTLEHLIDTRLADQPAKRAALSYAIKRAVKNTKGFAEFDSKVFERVVSENYLPDVMEQANALILTIGTRQDSPGSSCELVPSHLLATIGAVSYRDIIYLIQELLAQKLIAGSTRKESAEVKLTFIGWERFHALSKMTTAGHTAFMAMSFSNEKLTELVDQTLRPAVSQTGFTLVRLDDQPIAGSIDDRLRLEIRRSAFLISDLTDGNAGAYWEAGFAEGIGKPVIYLCNKQTFKKKGTHFDTSHHHTVLWDQDEPEQAAEDLKATIRATLPEFAKLTDS